MQEQTRIDVREDKYYLVVLSHNEGEHLNLIYWVVDNKVTVLIGRYTAANEYAAREFYDYLVSLINGNLEAIKNISGKYWCFPKNPITYVIEHRN